MKEAYSPLRTPSVRNPNTNDRSWSEWFDEAKSKTKEFREKAQVFGEIASKIAHDKATEIARQAIEISEKYDLEVTRNAIISKIGGPVDTTTNEINTGLRNRSVLDLVYVTENLISMAFPRDLKKCKKSEGGNDIQIISRFLKQRHGNHFMIWNVSEEVYDYSYFSHQVLEYKFPGHPSPPLGLLFKICASVKSWLDADEKNVAVIHCITGKGRTAALMACILTWIDEFSAPMEALQYVAERRGISAEQLTIPSQRRYLQYFSNVLNQDLSHCY
jgi:tensin